jgi:hypothetical protein
MEAGVMERGKLGTLVDSLRGEVERVPERKEGPDSKYKNWDGVGSALGALFFQYPSFLRYQREMKDAEKRDNVESLFGVGGIPSDNEIRKIADGIEPAKIGGVFNATLSGAGRSTVDEYRVLDKGVLIAIDGVWYHSSEKIHCEHCLREEETDKEGEKHEVYFHAAVAGAIVKPHSNRVLPVAPEVIRNEDGEKKQDCERNAGKRWLAGHGEEYAWLKPTLLGDDLYSNEPFCRAVEQNHMSFIFTCKPNTHKWLTETVNNSYLHEVRQAVVNHHKRNHDILTWRYINGVDLKYEESGALKVNYLEFTMRNEASSKPSYHNSWVTDKEITDNNVAYLAECGRTRWKIENEHNNVLKNRGYNLEHNFGHGKEHACDVFFLLNLLSLQFHTILEACDEEYRVTFSAFPGRVAFFEAMRVLISRRYFASWPEFLRYVRGKDAEFF